MTDGMQQVMFNVAQCAFLIIVIRIVRQCDMRMFERFDQGEPAFMVEFMRDPSRIKAPSQDARHQNDERGQPEGSFRKKFVMHGASLSRPILSGRSVPLIRGRPRGEAK